MSARWKVKGIPLSGFNQEGGSVGEPFWGFLDTAGKPIILTKEAVFYEGDEPQSSTKHPQMERPRG